MTTHQTDTATTDVPRRLDSHAPEVGDARFASTLLLAGAALLLIGNSTHPVDADPSPTSRLDLAGDGNWIMIHLVIVVGVLVAAAGLGAVARLAASPQARRHAAVGTLGAIAGATMLAVVFGALDGYGASSLADEWATASGEQRIVVEAAAVALDAADSGITAIGILAFFGLAIGFVGRALLADRALPSWLGWTGMAIGALGLATGVAWAIQGPTALTINALFRPLALATTAWFIALGIVLRRSTRPSPRRRARA